MICCHVFGDISCQYYTRNEIRDASFSSFPNRMSYPMRSIQKPLLKFLLAAHWIRHGIFEWAKAGIPFYFVVVNYAILFSDRSVCSQVCTYLLCLSLSVIACSILFYALCRPGDTPSVITSKPPLPPPQPPSNSLRSSIEQFTGPSRRGPSNHGLAPSRNLYHSEQSLYTPVSYNGYPNDSQYDPRGHYDSGPYGYPPPRHSLAPPYPEHPSHYSSLSSLYHPEPFRHHPEPLRHHPPPHQNQPRHCAQCGETLSPIAKRRALCSVCEQWICKLCAVWEPQTETYICAEHEEQINLWVSLWWEKFGICHANGWVPN